MTNRSSCAVQLSATHSASNASRKHSGIRAKTFLTALMSLLSILVFGLGLERKSVLWLWIGFICALVSGIFVQLLIDRKKKNERLESRG